MTYDEMNDLYFSWIEKLISNDEMTASDYRKLLSFLNDIQFDYLIPMDDNRIADGIDLRYRFGYDAEIPYAQIATYLDIRPASVLEVMVALSLRIEEQFIDGDDVGNWFWIMIANLGLDEYKDLYFNKAEVDRIIKKFLKRDYEKNGRGSLFITNDRNKDMRQIEIWDQMHLYLNEFVFS
nr:MAG TPA: hypothetical protein [Caudoviricetes sp.]